MTAPQYACNIPLIGYVIQENDKQQRSKVTPLRHPRRSIDTAQRMGSHLHEVCATSKIGTHPGQQLHRQAKRFELCEQQGVRNAIEGSLDVLCVS